MCLDPKRLWLMTETKILPKSGDVTKCHAPESPLQALELRFPVLFQMGVPLKHGSCQHWLILLFTMKSGATTPVLLMIHAFWL